MMIRFSILWVQVMNIFNRCYDKTFMKVMVLLFLSLYKVICCWKWKLNVQELRINMHLHYDKQYTTVLKERYLKWVLQQQSSVSMNKEWKYKLFFFLVWVYTNFSYGVSAVFSALFLSSYDQYSPYCNIWANLIFPILNNWVKSLSRVHDRMKIKEWEVIKSE